MGVTRAYPSPTSGTGAWLRANAPTIASPAFTGTASFNAGVLSALGLSFYSSSFGIGMDGNNMVVIGGPIFKGNGLNGTQDMRVAIGTGVTIGNGSLAAGSRLTVVTAGSPNAIVTSEATGNSGFGAAAHATRRIYALGATGYTAIYGEGTNAPGVEALSVTSHGLISQSTQFCGVYVKQAGSLTGNNAFAAVYIHRNLTLGAFDATNATLVVEDATAATGNLLRCVKQGTDRIIGTPAGKVLALAGIGAGNSAAATTPGTVTKKLEVFDFAGASLGFVPIYDAIT